jgi:hypothetical protein
MKNMCKRKPAFGAGVVGIFGIVFMALQSCQPANDVKPVVASQTNTITVKVRDVNSSTLNNNQDLKHLIILASGVVVFDKDVTGNFSYSFISSKPDVKVTATLTSNSDFISALEIDANNQMHAYHNGSCSVKEFDISDEVSF